MRFWRIGLTPITQRSSDLTLLGVFLRKGGPLLGSIWNNANLKD